MKIALQLIYVHIHILVIDGYLYVRIGTILLPPVELDSVNSVQD